ncbi:hypothetical protein GpartN1_g2400.t1 [Galdieria partita]|uniref:Uncharacterized protein n=1 Tax=Galdieria partita TaxID=83374 RepID=A0A9C7PUS0_9RHOD|nr:hypothetical protein GpartN1_g2400.t1 [Galdieria partita]
MFSRSSNHQLKLQPRPTTEFRVLPKFEEKQETPKNQGSKLKQVLNYLSDHFCPWDYDLYRPDITFFQVWNVTSEEERVPLRFSVTVKPFSSQAKFSLRARLFQLGKEGFFFAKAASYVCPHRTTVPNDYYGFEADKIVASFGKEQLTKLYLNTNLKSSRKSNQRVLGSIGVQQKIVFDSSRKLTLRLGYNSRQEIYVTPIPNGLYF